MIPVSVNELIKNKVYYFKIIQNKSDANSDTNSETNYIYKKGKFESFGFSTSKKYILFYVNFIKNNIECIKHWGFETDETKIYLPEAEQIEKRSVLRQYFAILFNKATNTTIGDQLKYLVGEYL